jgi:hypothetical protein
MSPFDISRVRVQPPLSRTGSEANEARPGGSGHAEILSFQSGERAPVLARLLVIHLYSHKNLVDDSTRERKKKNDQA